jgi:hypothetical protein
LRGWYFLPLELTISEMSSHSPDTRAEQICDILVDSIHNSVFTLPIEFNSLFCSTSQPKLFGFWCRPNLQTQIIGGEVFLFCKTSFMLYGQRCCLRFSAGDICPSPIADFWVLTASTKANSCYQYHWN